MRLLKVAIISLLLFGCSEENRKKFFPTAAERTEGIRYVKDQRTGLCFVYNYVDSSAQGGGGAVFANVPCSPEVEKLIEK